MSLGRVGELAERLVVIVNPQGHDQDAITDFDATRIESDDRVVHRSLLG
jgi:uncharacterized protein YdbL (DUF1318 family)